MSKKKQTTAETQPKKKRKNSRAKGKGFERETAKHLTEWWGVPFHSTPASGGLHWKNDNRVSGDIVAPVDSNFPFNVECKKVEGWNFEQVIKGTGDVTSWWNQCIGDSEESGKTPLLIFSKNRSPIYFMLRYEDFRNLDDNGTYFNTNYFLTTISTGENTFDCVGIGFFDSLKAIPKDLVVKLLD